MPEPIVVDTGPVIALTACGRLELLPALYGPVLVPAGVVDELRRRNRWPPAGLATPPP